MYDFLLIILILILVIGFSFGLANGTWYISGSSAKINDNTLFLKHRMIKANLNIYDIAEIEELMNPSDIDKNDGYQLVMAPYFSYSTETYSIGFERVSFKTTDMKKYIFVFNNPDIKESIIEDILKKSSKIKYHTFFPT